MKTSLGGSKDAMVETVTRYIGYEIALTDDFAEDVGLDSIDRVNLMTTIEQAHGLELSDADMASTNTLQDLLRHLDAVREENDVNATRSDGIRKQR